jgi:hypothetical protein
VSLPDVIVGGAIATAANVALFAAGARADRRREVSAAVVALGQAAVSQVNFWQTSREQRGKAAPRMPEPVQQLWRESAHQTLMLGMAAWERLLAHGPRRIIPAAKRLMVAMEELSTKAQDLSLPAKEFDQLVETVQTERANLLAGRSRQRRAAIREAYGR